MTTNPALRDWVEETAKLTQPERIHWCTGTDSERNELTQLMLGTGDLIEPDDGIVAIGSGGPYALSAARALASNTELDARAIAERAMQIAGDICIYTNGNIVIEEL